MEASGKDALERLLGRSPNAAGAWMRWSGRHAGDS